jgi:hypothetical protein
LNLPPPQNQIDQCSNNYRLKINKNCCILNRFRFFAGVLSGFIDNYRIAIAAGYDRLRDNSLGRAGNAIRSIVYI